MVTKPKKEVVSIDLSCKQTLENDIETKDGPRTTYSSVFEGTTLVGGEIVSAKLTLKAGKKDALEHVVPVMIGATRMIDISRTNEDLANHDI